MRAASTPNGVCRWAGVRVRAWSKKPAWGVGGHYLTTSNLPTGMLREKELTIIGRQLKKHGFQDLAEYYKSTNWQMVKEWMVEFHPESHCFVCETNLFLQVQHKTFTSLCGEKPEHMCWLCTHCQEIVQDVSLFNDLAIWSAILLVRQYFRMEKFTYLCDLVTDYRKTIRSTRSAPEEEGIVVDTYTLVV